MQYGTALSLGWFGLGLSEHVAEVSVTTITAQGRRYDVAAGCSGALRNLPMPSRPMSTDCIRKHVDFNSSGWDAASTVARRFMAEAIAVGFIRCQVRVDAVATRPAVLHWSPDWTGPGISQPATEPMQMFFSDFERDSLYRGASVEMLHEAQPDRV